MIIERLMPQSYLRGRGLLGRTLASALLAAAVALVVMPARAQPYPSKLVRIVATASAGGSIDVVARLLGQRLSQSLGQPFVIENRAGAGGNIGGAYVAKAPADGYTLMLGSSPVLAANSHLYVHMQYDPLKDFTPIILVARQPNVLVVGSSFPASNVGELIALAKSRPTKLSYGSGGMGNSQHIAAELFAMLAGVQMVHIPYKGSAPALANLVSGQIDLMLDTMPSALPYINGGQLKALAVTTTQRSNMLLDVPTLAEAGLPDYDYYGFLGLVGPAGLSKDIVARLNTEIQATLAGDLRPKLAELGRDDRPWGGSDPPAVAYVYAPDRKAQRPVVHLSGFAGTLQVDGCGGYRVLAERGDVQLAFCWAHVRRRFYEFAAAGPAPIASEALKRITTFYAVEKDRDVA